MTAWAQSLIRISNYEVETLQKRLAEIAEHRAGAELRIAVLDAEALADWLSEAIDYNDLLTLP